jgi:hypothetical protein
MNNIKNATDALKSAINDFLISDVRFLTLPPGAGESVLNELVADIRGWANEKDTPTELALCESHRVQLRPNVPYIFRVDDKCKPCLTCGEFADALSRVPASYAAQQNSMNQA